MRRSINRNHCCSSHLLLSVKDRTSLANSAIVLLLVHTSTQVDPSGVSFPNSHPSYFCFTQVVLQDACSYATGFFCLSLFSFINNNHTKSVTLMIHLLN